MALHHRFRLTKRRALGAGAFSVDGHPVTSCEQNQACTPWDLNIFGGTGPYFVDFPSAPLAHGMAATQTDADTWRFDGTPDIVGVTSPIVVRVRDSSTPQQTVLLPAYTFTVTAPPAGTITLPNVTVRRGALTKANRAAYQVLASTAFVAAAIISAASNYVISPSGAITRTVDSCADITLTVRVTDSTGAHADGDIFFDSEPATYSVAADGSGAETELKEALTLIGFAGGKNVLMEPGRHKPTYSTEAWNSRGFLLPVKIESRVHDQATMTEILGPNLMKSPQNIEFSFLDFHAPQIKVYYAGGSSSAVGFSLTGTGIYNTIWSDCDIRATTWRSFQPTSQLPLWEDIGYLGIIGCDGSARASGAGVGQPAAVGIKFLRCDIYGGRRLLNMPPSNRTANNPGYTVVEECFLHEFGSDCFVGQGGHKVIRKNFMYNPYADNGKLPSGALIDPGHGDFVQASNGAFLNSDWYINRNVTIVIRDDAKVGNKASYQNNFLQTGAAGSGGNNQGYPFTNVCVWGNLHIGSTVYGFMCSNPINVQVIGNTYLCSLALNPASSRPNISFQIQDAEHLIRTGGGNAGDFASASGWRQAPSWVKNTPYTTGTYLSNGEITVYRVTSNHTSAAAIGTDIAAGRLVVEAVTPWNISGGKATKTPGSGGIFDACRELWRPIAPPSGETYDIDNTVSGRTTGQVQIKLTGGAGINGAIRTTNGSFTDSVTAISGLTKFVVSPDTAWDGSVDDISMMRTSNAAPGYAIDTIVKDNVAASWSAPVGNGCVVENNVSWQGETEVTNHYPEQFLGPTYSPLNYAQAMLLFRRKPGGSLTVAGGALRNIGALNDDGTLLSSPPAGITLLDPV